MQDSFYGANPGLQGRKTAGWTSLQGAAIVSRVAKPKLTLAHSPDSDDAFMFYALASGKVETRGYEFIHELHDIETLNLRAEDGLYDLTAISFHAYPYVRKHYRLMTCGSSIGDGYGPLVVAKRSLSVRDLDEVTIAVAGTMTTSYLALKLFCPGARTKVMPFDKIMDAVVRGEVDAGLLIHEGQLTWSDHKLTRVVDLGEWWSRETGLPLPLGGNALKRSLDRKATSACCDVMRDTVQFALDHRNDALDYAIQYSRGLDRKRADKFVGMYVNDLTLDLGDRGAEAVALLFRLGHEAGVIEELVEPEFVD
jgi:1,4-dihydroxy-6-naphthoate synthase